MQLNNGSDSLYNGIINQRNNQSFRHYESFMLLKSYCCETFNLTFI